MSVTARTAVVLLQLGGPDNLDAIEPYLHNMFNHRDRVSAPWLFRSFIAKRIAREYAPTLRPIYQGFGGGSPAIPQAEAQAKIFERRLTSMGLGFSVRVGMRLWHPFIEDVVRDLIEHGIERIIALPLHPHSSRLTVIDQVNEFKRAVAKVKPGVQVMTTAGFGEHPRYIECMSELLQRTLSMDAEGAPQPMHVLFTAHAVPETSVERGDSYPEHVKASVEAIVGHVTGKPEWSLCFHKGIGPDKWNGPFIEDRIHELGQSGVRSLIVVPASYVSEQIETLYDLDEKYYAIAEQCGIECYMRVATPQTNPVFIDALTDLVMEALDVNRNSDGP